MGNMEQFIIRSIICLIGAAMTSYGCLLTAKQRRYSSLIHGAAISLLCLVALTPWHTHTDHDGSTNGEVASVITPAGAKQVGQVGQRTIVHGKPPAVENKSSTVDGELWTIDGEPSTINDQPSVIAAAKVKLPFVASAIKKTYHARECHYCKMIEPEYVREFASEADAAETGRQPCKECMRSFAGK